jgi:hypothetical protein
MGDDPSIFLVPTVKKGCSGAPSAAPQARCAAQGESSKISSLGHCDLDERRLILLALIAFLSDQRTFHILIFDVFHCVQYVLFIN